jgi:Zn-dependent metalloprotease
MNGRKETKSFSYIMPARTYLFGGSLAQKTRFLGSLIQRLAASTLPRHTIRNTNMAPICCIVPEHVLEKIVEMGQAPEHVINACQSTIDKTKELHNIRIARGQSLLASQGQQPSEGIIPPYIHERIAQHAVTEDQRDSFLRTFTHDTENPLAAGTVRHLNRTVYNAQNSTEDLPRDDIMIKEHGALISKEQDPSTDANECYAGFGKTYDFYFQFFNRDSINGRGLKLDGFVHFGKGYLNAFWDGSEMVFGDGDGLVFNGFTDELDVIGHELTHGVVQYSSPLDYSFQSGALNESLADVFGIMIKQWGEDPENPQTADQSNWLIGEGIWANGIKGRALRDMKAPGTAYDDERVGSDPQPAHWKDFKRLPLTSDRGGVHINSGIPNYAFYLASTRIGGYSWQTAGPIWYKALNSGKLSGNATFKEFADLTVLYAGEHEAKIREAWSQVGHPFDDSRHEL